jgi:hypothetical protein
LRTLPQKRDCSGTWGQKNEAGKEYRVDERHSTRRRGVEMKSFLKKRERRRKEEVKKKRVPAFDGKEN